jgi:nucleotide-binding universal stress UspA family protein
MRVLLPTDGSEASLEAARRAMALLPRTAVVTVLAVVRADPGLSRDELDAAGEAMLDRTVPVVGEAGRLVDAGDPTDCIIANAEELEADLIVVGSHGRDAVERVIHGSVSEDVVRGARCPVLVVPLEET